jgi:hypothetical protein
MRMMMDETIKFTIIAFTGIFHIGSTLDTQSDQGKASATASAIVNRADPDIPPIPETKRFATNRYEINNPQPLPQVCTKRFTIAEPVLASLSPFTVLFMLTVTNNNVSKNRRPTTAEATRVTKSESNRKIMHDILIHNFKKGIE